MDIFYINLNHRTDRNKHVLQQIETIGCTGIRIEAVECKHGAIGCGMSHIRCLELAKENNLPFVCIVEDDITFTNPDLFRSQLDSFLSSSMDWDVLLLGTNMGPPFDKEEGCLRVFNAQTTTGYIVKHHYYDTLLNSFKRSVGYLLTDYNVKMFAIDIQWKQLQKRDRWYVLYPLTVIQREDYSDIEKRQVNYEVLMTSTKERV
jgi:GR25 family glycosyltransferase involved in LPS biosynthesis